ncbi:hypothetical protein, partial [Dawidia soli]|nr:hypothetical protein [Dawidia soli]
PPPPPPPFSPPPPAPELRVRLVGAEWCIRDRYSLLLRINPSPIIELNRAIALAMHKGPEAGLRQIDAILERGELTGYHLAHAARAELCRKTGRTDQARASWERALALAQQAPERRFIERKLRELET